ncbi:Craniofacial development protein 1 [Apophysomyces ossiformis]|uniref:SWR1-complex protein 5 n=1 Tax=Apophysomyces ossiformis TaxID=679940 RepID=A0A8H7ETL5_9FUNG|nr:Craniofacial development protein 1 [Apophysomyces ossiformis]
MAPTVDHETERKLPYKNQILLAAELDSDSEDDSDYVPDQAGSESEEENDTGDNQVPGDITVSKRKLKGDGPLSKRQRTNDTLTSTESERKARLDAIWAEMNSQPKDRKKRPFISTVAVEDTANCDNNNNNNNKQSLDDISSSVNCADRLKKQDHGVGSPVRKKPAIVRPKSTLGDLVSQYNIKVPKLNTLEKSRLDWQGYVDRAGIREDLKYRNKDGYMEKVAFLQRVDDRRLTQLKAGQKASKR